MSSKDNTYTDIYMYKRNTKIKFIYKNRSMEWKTPLTRSEEMGRGDIAKLLKEYGDNNL